MLKMSIITPVIGAIYLIWQIHKRDLRGWQHYACLTSLIFLISILFLVASGKVESFDVAGNNVRLVDQKLEEVKALTEQNKLLAQKTVAMVERVTSGALADMSYDAKAAHKTKLICLKQLGFLAQTLKSFLMN
jgi:hypothetical protein